MHMRQVLGDPAPRRLDEIDAVVVVFLDPVATAKMFGSKMMSFGGKPTSFQQVIGARADFDLAVLGIGLPGSSKAMTTTAAP